MLDENTGLPELPEGYFWRVEHPLLHIHSGIYQRDTDRLQVGLMKQPEDTLEPDPRSKWVQKILPAKREVSTQTPKMLYLSACKGTSDQAIRDAAYTILKRKREDERLASKLGDYPPKKLGG